MQSILFKGQAAAMIMSAPDQNVFRRPMSSGARALLAAMLEWGASFVSYFGGPRNLMTEFCASFNQIRFEEAEQMYQTDMYVKIVVGSVGVKTRPGVKPKTKAEVLAVMTLEKLFDQNWSHGHSIPSKHRMGDITQAADIYNWLVDYFLLGDFSPGDVGKIAEMGRMCKLDIVRHDALEIPETDKHTIPYLYAKVRNNLSRDEITKSREQIKDVENLKKLAALGSLAMGVEEKIAHKFDQDQKKKWQIEREFADLLRTLDN